MPEISTEMVDRVKDYMKTYVSGYKQAMPRNGNNTLR